MADLLPPDDAAPSAAPHKASPPGETTPDEPTPDEPTQDAPMPDAPAPAPDESAPDRPRPKIGEGPGRLLVSLYALFTVAAGSRAAFQLIAQYHRAPLSYILSAFAAVVYAFILVTLVRGGESARRIALVCCGVELAGVLVIGTLSIAVQSWFPDQTVWSYYGADYLFIPLVLPVTGMLWLRRAGRPQTDPETGSETGSEARAKAVTTA